MNKRSSSCESFEMVSMKDLSLEEDEDEKHARLFHASFYTTGMWKIIDSYNVSEYLAARGAQAEFNSIFPKAILHIDCMDYYRESYYLMGDQKYFEETIDVVDLPNESSEIYETAVIEAETGNLVVKNSWNGVVCLRIYERFYIEKEIAGQWEDTVEGTDGPRRISFIDVEEGELMKKANWHPYESRVFEEKDYSGFDHYIDGCKLVWMHDGKACTEFFMEGTDLIIKTTGMVRTVFKKIGEPEEE